MSVQEKILKCDHCEKVLSGDFCSYCGRPKEVKRINGQYLLAEIGSVLNFDKGILFTIRELLIRPGSSIRKFIRQDRNRLVKPILFIIICSLTYTILQQLFRFQDGYVNYSFGDKSATALIFNWVSQNYGYSNILMATFSALWIKLFFRKYGFNFFENLILLCFLMGMGMLLFGFFGILSSLIPVNVLDKGFLIAILYISWGIGAFFDKRKAINYFKGFLSYVLGIFSFTLFALLIGFLIDSLSN